MSTRHMITGFPDCPGTFAAFAFQAIVGCPSLAAATPTEIGETLLSGVDMAMFFVIADGVESFGAVDADDRAKNIGLLKIQIDQVG